MTPLHVDISDPTVKRLLAAAGVKNRKATVYGATSVTLSGTYWDGGHRTVYTAVSLETFQTVSLPRYNPPQFGGPMVDPKLDLTPEVAVVAFHYAGTRDHVTIYAHPDSLTKMLPSGGDDVTEHETLVLLYTAALKNTYGGETDIRFRHARRDHQITRAEWDAATETLKARKLLSKAGAITPDGRNAVANHPKRYRIS